MLVKFATFDASPGPSGITSDFLKTAGELVIVEPNSMSLIQIDNVIQI